MALTERSTHREKPGNSLISVPIAAAEVIYDGALVAISAAGEIQNWSDGLTSGNTSFFLGVARITERTGVSAATGEAKTGTTALNIEASVDISGVILEQVSVAGASDANVGNLVYATDENTLTMTATPGGAAVGWLTEFFSGTNANVKLFNPGEHRAHTFSAGGAGSSIGIDTVRTFTRTTAATSTTLTDTDDTLLVDASSGTATVNLPPAAGNQGKRFTIKKIDTSQFFVSLLPDGSDLIDGEIALNIRFRDAVGEVVSDGGTEWKLAQVPPNRGRDNFEIITADISPTIESNVLLISASAGARIYTLPDVATLTGRTLWIKKTDTTANPVTIVPLTSQTIDDESSVEITSPQGTIVLYAAQAAWHIISGSPTGLQPSFGAFVDKTINTAGAVTVTARHLRLSGTTADILTDLINPGDLKEGDLIMIRPASGETIVVETGTGNIRLDNDVDLNLLLVNHNIVLAWNDASSRFFQVSKGLGQA